MIRFHIKLFYFHSQLYFDCTFGADTHAYKNTVEPLHFMPFIWFHFTLISLSISAKLLNFIINFISWFLRGVWYIHSGYFDIDAFDNDYLLFLSFEMTKSFYRLTSSLITTASYSLHYLCNYTRANNLRFYNARKYAAHKLVSLPTWSFESYYYFSAAYMFWYFSLLDARDYYSFIFVSFDTISHMPLHISA